MLDTVKTITTREFFHSPGLLKTLHPGQSLVVTENGEPSLVVTKAGKRPRRSIEDLEREARQIVKRQGPKLNFTKMIREMDSK